MRMKENIEELEYSKVCTVVRVIAKMVPSMFVKVSEPRAEQIQDSAPLNYVLPPVLSH